MKRLLALAAGAALAAIAVPAAASQNWFARCTVRLGGERYDGPCGFLPEDYRGSYSAGPERQRFFFRDVTAVSVTVRRGGLAVVHGYTLDADRRPWGLAVRSRVDRACWVGPGFSVCGY